MKNEANQFFRSLHTDFFKPNGFKKTRNRFRREKEGLIEIVDFQGSGWNSSDEPWTFYINIGLGFTDLPSGGCFGIKEAHGSGRIEGLVKESPSQFDYTPEGEKKLKEELLPLIEEALTNLLIHKEEVYERAQRGHVSPIPVPETWK